MAAGPYDIDALLREHEQAEAEADAVRALWWSRVEAAQRAYEAFLVVYQAHGRIGDLLQAWADAQKAAEAAKDDVDAKFQRLQNLGLQLADFNNRN